MPKGTLSPLESSAAKPKVSLDSSCSITFKTHIITGHFSPCAIHSLQYCQVMTSKKPAESVHHCSEFYKAPRMSPVSSLFSFLFPPHPSYPVYMPFEISISYQFRNYKLIENRNRTGIKTKFFVKRLLHLFRNDHVSDS